MRLFGFQSDAAQELARRLDEYQRDDNAPYETRFHRVPLFLNLKAVTGAGKTVVLADALERMREVLPSEPVVLWVSKGKVVVEQTLASLELGKYSDLIPGFRVKALGECTADDLESDQAIVLMATVATFNQSDQDRRVFKSALDSQSRAIWDMLKQRLDSQGVVRPLVIVYDEGHNLSEQQTSLLLSLHPDAIVSASGTPRMTPAAAELVSRLKRSGWTDDRLNVSVPTAKVVESGLIKTHVVIGGYETSMETAVDDMLAEMDEVRRASRDLSAGLVPKAIYVCQTNVVEGGIKGEKDDPRQRFENRKAPPILIWRYLTEQKGIDPSKIAVYCDLDTHKDAPLPDSFVLFKGGDKDFTRFTDGRFEHVVFNLSLQEGWDDPQCYFAYVDKSMGSPVQIEQLIGRLLRQPNATHYQNDRLNTASFYIRVDKRSAFKQIVDEVSSNLGEVAGEVKVTVVNPTAKKRLLLPARKVKAIPKVSVDASAARKAVRPLVEMIPDFRKDVDNVLGLGGRVKVLKKVGESDQGEDFKWVDSEGANRITARSLFIRKVNSLYPKALNVCDIDDPKFDAMVQVGSKAAALFEQQAEQIVKTFLDHSALAQKASDPYQVGEVFVDPEPDKRKQFKYSLHESYGGLNKDEMAFAEALDKKRLPWFRNPSRSGYGIPLLETGGSSMFYPDFFVWSNGTVFALDPKGSHLITDAMRAKLLGIEQYGTGLKLVIRLISQGKYNTSTLKLESRNDGLTVWVLRQGAPYPLHCATVADAIDACLTWSQTPQHA